ncbi:MAG TPA: hypothetical protein VFT62_07670 [Mycobacteriales bacterium]|nr:hypothetical protein [Mycobacteriales bacterium]
MTAQPPPVLSSYDDEVPHPGADAELAARFAGLRRRRTAAHTTPAADVVLVVGSSRGGTSLLTELLRAHPDLLSLPGEMNPAVVIAQLAGGDAGVFRAELMRQVGHPARPDEVDRDQLVADVQWRLTAQWPRLKFDDDLPADWVDAALRTGGADPATFGAGLLERVAAAEPAVSLAAYDGSAGSMSDPAPPPAAPVVEMTPYIGFRPWRPATGSELRHQPVVIAAPRNSYRLDWLVGQLAPARVRVVHLTRNPAASVNGLIDGWHHPAFFSTPVPQRLDIAGYTELGAWGRSWWKFDVPPRWRELTTAPLAAVAAEQWRSTHAAALDFAARGDAPVLRVRYEDLVGPAAAREAVVLQLAEFIGADPAPLRDRVVAGIDPVMATAPPRQRRWAAGVHDLSPALAEPSVWEIAVALGYEAEEALWI